MTPWTTACVTPLSIGFSRQEYWSGLPFPPSGFLPNPGIEPASPASPALAGGFFTTEPPEKPSLKTSLTALHLFLAVIKSDACHNVIDQSCIHFFHSFPETGLGGTSSQEVCSNALVLS